MRAFVADALWEPRIGYKLSADEKNRKRAVCGSQVWKNPSFSFKDVAVPRLKDDEILVKVVTCGICGSDSHLYETDSDGYIIFSGPVKLPCTIGHEYSGIVVEIGKNVSEFKKGDPVAGESVIWCGQCTPCRSGSLNQCNHAELAGITQDGAFAEYVAVNQRQLWNIEILSQQYNDKMLFEIGALIEPVGCAYNGMFISAGGFLPGATVVVYGAGPIGLGGAALAALAGAGKVIVFDKIMERLDIAKRIGASHVFDVAKLAGDGITSSEVVMELTAGKGAGVQIEAAGSAGQTVPEMEKAMAVNGKIVYLGRTGREASISLDTFVTGANGIVGARGHCGYGIYPNIIQLLADGKLRIADIITSRLEFTDIQAGLEKSVCRKDGKILIQM